MGTRVRITSGLLTEALPLLPKLVPLPVGRVFLAHNIMAGLLAVGFWLAVVGFAGLCPPVSVGLIPLVAYGVAVYAGEAATQES